MQLMVVKKTGGFGAHRSCQYTKTMQNNRAGKFDDRRSLQLYNVYSTNTLK